MASNEPQPTVGQASDNTEFTFSGEPTLEDIRRMLCEFARERNWDQFHSPRNVLLALVGEVGELAEIFQWKGEVKEGLPEFTAAEKEHVGQELSDVLIYLVNLAYRCRVNLPAAVMKKFEQNKQKYPAHTVYGCSNKYTAYQSTDKVTESGDNGNV